MPVPAYDQFIEPVLRFLAQHPEGAAAGDAHEAAADALRLTADDRAELLPSGAQPVYKNRAGWAHDRLKRHGLSSSPKRGLWKLTSNGLTYAKAHPKLSEAEIDQLTEVGRASRLSRKDASAETVPPPQPTERVRTRESPDERIELAIEEIQTAVARDLLERIAQAPPVFFERLVLELLHAMGYGTTRDDLQRVGKSGDGGIDGIISLDRLGLEKVYVQAKRWQNTVGSDEIQGFMGALQLHTADKGVFLTTSEFTKPAREAAARARGSIVLVDGNRLTALMMEHGVAVTHRVYKVPKVDGDYFDEE